MKYAFSNLLRASAGLAVAALAIAATPALADAGLNTSVYYNCCSANQAPDYTFVNTNDSLTWHAGYGSDGTTTAAFFGADAAGQALTDTNAASNLKVVSQGYIDVPTAATYTFNLSADDFAQLFIDGASVALAPNYYTASVPGTLTLSAGYHSFDLTYLAGGSPNGMWFSYSGGPLSFSTTDSAVAAVPEPATWTMMLAGFGAIGFAARRKRTLTATKTA